MELRDRLLALAPGHVPTRDAERIFPAVAPVPNRNAWPARALLVGLRQALVLPGEDIGQTVADVAANAQVAR